MKILEYLVPPVTQELKSRQNTTKIPLMSFKPDNTNPSNSFQVSNHKNTTSSSLRNYLCTFANSSMIACTVAIPSLSYIDVAFSTPWDYASVSRGFSHEKEALVII